MNIGNKIRELRKRRGITQEQLAESIGVSFQAISKWETNISLPDITLAPVLANYFGVSMDKLFDFSIRETEQRIKEIVDEAYSYRDSDPIRSRRILEDGLKTYPENDVLLNNLLYVLDYSKDPDETIAIADKLIGSTTRDDVKFDALRFLAYAYKEKGDLESAKAALEQIPEIYFTKLSEIAYVLSGEAKQEAAEKQKWLSFENLLQMMTKIAEYYEEIGDNTKAIEEIEKAMTLISILNNGCFNIYTDFFNKQISRLNDE